MKPVLGVIAAWFSASVLVWLLVTAVVVLTSGAGGSGLEALFTLALGVVLFTAIGIILWRRLDPGGGRIAAVIVHGVLGAITTLLMAAAQI